MKKLDNRKYNKLLNKLMPGGAQTYSRGFDQFPDNAPPLLIKGKDQYIYDLNNSKFLDYGMGLRSIILGYANKQVNKEAIKGILSGNNLPRPSNIELKYAQKLIKHIPQIDMVKFAKNGSNVTSGAIKLSRSYNKKNLILRCSDHPFFSFDDWFIGSTVMNKGVPDKIKSLTKTFKYGDIENLKSVVKKYKNEISCLIMEASTTECPGIDGESGCCGKFKCDRNYQKNHYLKEVQNICQENKIIFIIDETITGFRWHLKGAIHRYNINPDLVIYGKAIANGFSVSVLAGKKKYMNHANITKPNHERTFLLSSTHGGEISSLAAGMKTLDILKNSKTIENIWDHGIKLTNEINALSESLGIKKNVFISGVPCSPIINTIFKNSNNLKLRTLLIKELISQKIFIPWVSICGKHNDKDIRTINKALKIVLPKVRYAIGVNFKKIYIGKVVKPVFRKFN